jgi:phosphoglycolate phosphatase-like HAD superfamily hydrolase
MYLDALMERVEGRLEGLESGRTAPEEWLVPGSRALLDSLKARGLKLYLASGTDHADVVREAKLLGISRFLRRRRVRRARRFEGVFEGHSRQEDRRFGRTPGRGVSGLRRPGTSRCRW